jgi:hypothetical protein
MSNKVIQAAGNFIRGDIETTPEPFVSVAEAHNIPAPPPTLAEKEGVNAEGSLLKKRYEVQAAAHEKYLAEKAKFETARDNAIWAAVLRRRVGA